MEREASGQDDADVFGGHRRGNDIALWVGCCAAHWKTRSHTSWACPTHVLGQLQHKYWPQSGYFFSPSPAPPPSPAPEPSPSPLHPLPSSSASSSLDAGAHKAGANVTSRGSMLAVSVARELVAECRAIGLHSARGAKMRRTLGCSRPGPGERELQELPHGCMAMPRARGMQARGWATHSRTVEMAVGDSWGSPTETPQRTLAHQVIASPRRDHTHRSAFLLAGPRAPCLKNRRQSRNSPAAPLTHPRHHPALTADRRVSPARSRPNCPRPWRGARPRFAMSGGRLRRGSTAVDHGFSDGGNKSRGRPPQPDGRGGREAGVKRQTGLFCNPSRARHPSRFDPPPYI